MIYKRDKKLSSALVLTVSLGFYAFQFFLKKKNLNTDLIISYATHIVVKSCRLQVYCVLNRRSLQLVGIERLPFTGKLPTQRQQCSSRLLKDVSLKSEISSFFFLAVLPSKLLMSLRTAAAIYLLPFPLSILHRDCREEEESEPRVWSNFHEDDILSAATYPTGLVATSAYDGVVKVWNIESGYVNCKLNANDYGLQTTQSAITADIQRQVSYSNAGQ